MLIINPRHLTQVGLCPSPVTGQGSSNMHPPFLPPPGLAHGRCTHARLASQNMERKSKAPWPGGGSKPQQPGASCLLQCNPRGFGTDTPGPMAAGPGWAPEPCPGRALEVGCRVQSEDANKQPRSERTSTTPRQPYSEVDSAAWMGRNGMARKNLVKREKRFNSEAGDEFGCSSKK